MLRETVEKECKVHGITKHFIENSVKKTARCAKCEVEAVTKRRRKLKLLAIEHMGGKCFDCGLVSPCPGIYDFHHTGGKDFSISKNGNTMGWEKIKKELEKCVMLCSNCHRIRHYSFEMAFPAGV